MIIQVHRQSLELLSGCTNSPALILSIGALDVQSHKLEVHNPVANTTARAAGVAPRLADLSGKRLALYWNAKPNADSTLLRIAENLKRRFTGLTCDLIIGSRPGLKERVDEARHYDAVVAASGD